MITNLTDYQLEVACWLAQQHESGQLPETFSVRWKSDRQEKAAVIKDFKGKQFEITHAALVILEQEGLIQTIEKDIDDPKKLLVFGDETNLLLRCISLKKERLVEHFAFAMISSRRGIYI